MAAASYRGFTLKSAGNSTDVWQVQIKNHTLQGSMAAVKKSIDWFCDTATIIDPKEFNSLSKQHAASGQPSQEVFHGYTIKNDTGEPNSWYCFFNGRLIKGGKLAIQKHIEAYLVAKQKAQQKK
ncbi:tail protein [Vibrio tubiashii]|nr:tail protein [Vibrio tubiashii]